MTAQPNTTNSGPGEPLSASVAASTPPAGVTRRRDPLSGPQAGAQSLGRPWHALARRYDAWEHAALNCPHRKGLRRYRWPYTALCAIRIGPAWISAIRRRPT